MLINGSIIVKILIVQIKINRIGTVEILQMGICWENKSELNKNKFMCMFFILEMFSKSK
jgi:hypothetical protein